MKISRIGIVSVFIILFSVSCRSGEDMSAYFDEGRIENNIYISDSTGLKMMIPEGWKPVLKMNKKDEGRVREKLDNMEVSVAPFIRLISLEKDKYNRFRSGHEIFERIDKKKELREDLMADRELISYVFPPPVKIIAVNPIIRETIDSIDFLTFSYECFLPSPINKKLYGITYVGIVRNKFLFITINYTDLENRKEIMDAWLNSTFDKSKWRRY